jgi:voltage-gated potassium channel Kch
MLVPPTLVVLLQRGFGQYVSGAEMAVSNPDQLGTVFVRWGHQGYDPGNIFFGDGTNLSVLESMPIAAAVVVGPVRYGVSAVRGRFDDVELPLTAGDAFALVFSALLVTLFLPRLPIHVMATVRYLHPLYPLLVYALFRQRWLREVLDGHTEHALWGYEAAVLLGTPLVVGALITVTVTKGGVFQGFARAGLVASGLLLASGTAFASGRTDGRPVALSFGLAAGITTVFLLVTSFVVMHYGPSALPAVETITGDIRFQTIV